MIEFWTTFHTCRPKSFGELWLLIWFFGVLGAPPLNDVEKSIARVLATEKENVWHKVSFTLGPVIGGFLILIGNVIVLTIILRKRKVKNNKEVTGKNNKLKLVG